MRYTEDHPFSETCYGVIYKITNIINNKIYIGQKINPQKWYKYYWGSGLIIKRAIKKWGRNNFKKEVVCECSSQEELDSKEAYYIKLYESYIPEIGYNILKYGKTTKGFKAYDAWIRDYGEDYAKERWEKKCKAHSKNMKGKLVREKNPMFGKKISKEHNKILESYRSIGYKHTEETKKKISQAKKAQGKKLTVEQRNKLSEVRKLWYKTHDNPRVGTKASEETREKMRRTFKERGVNKGSKNPMFGKSVYKLWVDKYGIEEADERKRALLAKRLETLRKNKEKV